ncbi:hypothetical protein NEOLEDRAFT_1151751 [Neolentinus lepideus HHB14362 ss-1]|uniref:Uncharacterized protein n=1 Tax=Neolentinus lepideus HHB14362 ss-1 TaxID=1314782 RepID=A0A165NM58_9AGAM|nr:hypothetical protein NEOLEDRAFT_1151751 [Neolentinus lepideus HHB14362 ss-1]
MEAPPSQASQVAFDKCKAPSGEVGNGKRTLKKLKLSLQNPLSGLSPSIMMPAGVDGITAPSSSIVLPAVPVVAAPAPPLSPAWVPSPVPDDVDTSAVETISDTAMTGTKGSMDNMGGNELDPSIDNTSLSNSATTALNDTAVIVDPTINACKASVSAGPEALVSAGPEASTSLGLSAQGGDTGAILNVGCKKRATMAAPMQKLVDLRTARLLFVADHLTEHPNITESQVQWAWMAFLPEQKKVYEDRDKVLPPKLKGWKEKKADKENQG